MSDEGAHTPETAVNKAYAPAEMAPRVETDGVKKAMLDAATALFIAQLIS